MADAARESIESLAEVVGRLSLRVEKQEAELHQLRLSRRSRSRRPVQAESASRGSAISRSRLLRMAGVGAVAAAAAGVEMGGRDNTAFAKNGNPVTAGAMTNAEGGTMVSYDGPAGFGSAVLVGSDSTYPDSVSLSFPAGVAGLAGAGNTSGPGGVTNGVLGYTDNGAGNGVVGWNTNAVDGAGAGVFGLASGANAAGVSGKNELGNAVLGVTSSPDNDAAGVFGHHTGTGHGIGVHGKQDGTGIGGYFSSAQGTGLLVDGGSVGASIQIFSNTDGAVAVYGRIGVTEAGNMSAAVRGENDDTGNTGVGVWGSQAGGGNGGFFTSETGIALVATGSTGLQASGFTQAVYGTSHNRSDNASAIQGELTASTSGVDGAGVYGKNDATNATGCGVKGTHAGGGSGGLFTSETGIGVVAIGGTGLQASGFISAMYGTSHNRSDNASAILGELTASTSGVDAAGVYGKNDGANANGCGVKGTHAGGGSGGHFTSTAGDGISGKSSGNGAGIRGVSAGGRGGILSGHKAQLQLVPSTAQSHPASGQAGDLFLDAGHRLWLCLGKKRWKRLA